METNTQEILLNGESFSRSSVVMVSTVKAGETVSFSHYGESFYFITSTAPLEVKTESTAFKPYRKGTGEKFPQDLRFKRLEIRNNTDVDISFQLWIGFGQYIDTTSEIIEGYTNIIGQATTSLSPSAVLDLDGVPDGAHIQRKSLIVSNLDTANSIQILDSNDNVTCAVFPATSIILPISGRVKVKNGTASPISCYISEIWYSFLPYA